MCVRQSRVMNNPGTSATLDLFAHGGEMGTMMRHTNWAETPLGPVEQWPSPLKAAIRTLLECRLPMYLVWSREFIQFYNDAYVPILGNKHPKALGARAAATWREVWETVSPMWDEVWSGKGMAYTDYKFTLNRFGYPEDCYFDFSYSPLRADDGSVAGILVSLIETTRRVEAERRLQQQHDELRSMFMQAPASISIFKGPEHVFEFANPRYLDMLGRSDVIGKTIREVFPEIGGSGAYEALDGVYRTGVPFVSEEFLVPISTRPGAPPEDFYFSVSLYPLRDAAGAIFGQIVVSIDITSHVMSRRRLEALAGELLAQQSALQESEARFRELADAMPQIVWTARPDGFLDYYNERWYELTGFPRGGGGDESWKPILHPDDRQRTVDRWYHSVTTGEPYEIEYRYLDHRTGGYRWHLGRAVPIREDGGRIVRWYGTATDIDAQRRTEMLARDSEQSLSLAIEVTGIGTWDYHPETGDLRWSSSCRAIWGLGPDAPVVFEAWVNAIHADDRTRVTDAMAAAMSGENNGRYAVEFRMRRFDTGDERWLTAAGKVSFAADGTPQRFLGTTSDVTARKVTEVRRAYLDGVRDVLSATSDPHHMLREIARLAVPSMADWCAVDLIVDDTRQNLCSVHSDPDRVAEVQDVHRRSPSHPGDPLLATVADGHSALLDDLNGHLKRVATDAGYVAAVDRLGARSAVLVPVHLRGRLHALLWFITAESARRYSEDDRRFGDDLSRHVGMALEQGLLYRETSEARQEAEILNTVGRSVASELELEKVVQVITDAGTAATGAQFGAFFYNVIDQQGASYTLYTISGVPREKFANFPMPRATALFGPTFRGEGVIRLDDVRADPRFGKSGPHHGLPPGHLPVVSYLAVPVRSRSGEVLGGLFFGHPDVGRFDARDERVVIGIAAQAAIAIDNARFFQAERQARSQAEQLHREAIERTRVTQLGADIGAALVQKSSLRGILQRCAESLVANLDGALARIWVLEADTSTLLLQGSAGMYTHIDGAHGRVPVGAFKIGRIAQRLQPHVTNAVLGDPEVPDQEWVKQESLVSFAGYPLMLEDRLVGVVAMFARHPLSELTLNAIGSVANAMAIGIERVRAEEQLRAQATELSRTNVELQQFTYIASHDLQEPLRTITQYLDLLEIRYGDKLDDRARQYMRYASGGAGRMHDLINDLLLYSRLTHAEGSTFVDLGAMMKEILQDLAAMVSEADATVEVGPLPVIHAQQPKVRLLLQNLLGNALKFRGEKPCHISISAERLDATWTISVADNGIGIEPKYRERIFQVFHRLHAREKFPGTGMGLAICQRIIEQHEGRIWVDAAPDGGSVFTFTIPTGSAE